jgi:uroporphyrin-III C-methyltransferase
MNPVPPASSELILIGAGPGDPELVTLKAWRALQRADVILYDHLANTALLDLARPDCECISVGKRPYRATVTQEEIHELIRQKAAKGGTIIRLKGGDPFIFGRGFEEVLFARQLGLRVSYIPGITSMQTAGLSDIPLTHRAISESIWIVTGTKKDGSLSADLRLALQSKATVVIYMGMKKLAEIAALYTQEGFAGMPAAIIQNGSRPEQQLAVGTAGSLVELATAHGLSHPAVIVIGEVVGLSAAAEQKSRSAIPLYERRNKIVGM